MFLEIDGYCKEYIQSMPVVNTAMRITPFIDISDGEKSSGFSIRLGD